MASTLTLASLKQIVVSQNLQQKIKGYYKMNKPELINELEKHVNFDNDGTISLKENNPTEKEKENKLHTTYLILKARQRKINEYVEEFEQKKQNLLSEFERNKIEMHEIELKLKLKPTNEIKIETKKETKKEKKVETKKETKKETKTVNKKKEKEIKPVVVEEDEDEEDEPKANKDKTTLLILKARQRNLDKNFQASINEREKAEYVKEYVKNKEEIKLLENKIKQQETKVETKVEEDDDEETNEIPLWLKTLYSETNKISKDKKLKIKEKLRKLLEMEKRENFKYLAAGVVVKNKKDNTLNMIVRIGSSTITLTPVKYVEHKILNNTNEKEYYWHEAVLTNNKLSNTIKISDVVIYHTFLSEKK